MTDIIIRNSTLDFILSRRELMKDEISVLCVANYKTPDVEKLPAASGIGRVIELNKNLRMDQRMLNFIAKEMGIKASEMDNQISLDFDNFMSKVPRNMIAPGNPGLVYLVIKIDPENKAFWITYASVVSFFTNDRISISEASYEDEDYGLHSAAFFVKEWIEEESSRKSFSKDKKSTQKFFDEFQNLMIGNGMTIKDYKKFIKDYSFKSLDDLIEFIQDLAESYPDIESKYCEGTISELIENEDQMDMVKDIFGDVFSRKSFSSKREEYKYIRDAIRKQAGTASPVYKFYEKVVENMKDCDILKMEEVLDPKHFNAIKDGRIKIEPNHCWSNSYAVLTSPEFDDIKDEMFYCEGFADDGNKYPIEHGWLRYKDMYFDPTTEMIYPGRTVLKDYTSIIEIPYEEAVEMIKTTGQHGYNNLAVIAKRFLASKLSELSRKSFGDKERKVSDDYIIKTLKELSEKTGDNDITRDDSTLPILNMPEEFRDDFEKAINKNYKGIEFEYFSDKEDFYDRIEDYADKVIKKGLRNQLKKRPDDIFIGSIGQMDLGDEDFHEWHDYAGFVRIGLDKKNDIFDSDDLY